MEKIRNTVWLILLFSVIKYTVFSQTTEFVPLDENFSQVLKFHSVDTVTVIFPDDYNFLRADSVFVESYVFWEQFQKKPVYIYKKEQQLTEVDLGKNLQFCGPISGFKRMEILHIPVNKTSEGFILNGKLFNQPEDAFFYVNDDATHFYTCRNSENAIFPLRELPLGFYPFNIMRNGEFVYTGFISDKTGETKLNDLNALRSEYFLNPVKTKYFEIFAARPFEQDSILHCITKNTDAFVDSLCRVLNTNAGLLPFTKLYFYETREDLQNFLAQSLRQTIYGKSLAGSNHITGLNISTLRHEVGHTVIDFTLGKNPNPFWHEGLRQFTEYFFSEEAFQNDWQKTKENIELLTIGLIEGKPNYFSNWANYPVSGIFVKFLIDKYGIEKFKTAYRCDKMNDLLYIDENSTELLINDFKKYVYLMNKFGTTE